MCYEDQFDVLHTLHVLPASCMHVWACHSVVHGLNACLLCVIIGNNFMFQDPTEEVGCQDPEGGAG